MKGINLDRVEILKCVLQDLKDNKHYGSQKRDLYDGILLLVKCNCNTSIYNEKTFEKTHLMINRYNILRFIYHYIDCTVESIFYIACCNGYYNTVKYLINKGFDVNTKIPILYSLKTVCKEQHHLKSLFTEVYERGHIDIAYLLLKNGIDINPSDYSYKETSDCVLLPAKSEVITAMIKQFRKKEQQKQKFKKN